MTGLALECFTYRAKHRLSQKEMGQKCGVDRTQIIAVEKGRPVSRMTETKIRLVLEANEK